LPRLLSLRGRCAVAVAAAVAVVAAAAAAVLLLLPFLLLFLIVFPAKAGIHGPSLWLWDLTTP
jgi:hypothetical protein